MQNDQGVLLTRMTHRFSDIYGLREQSHSEDSRGQEE